MLIISIIFAAINVAFLATMNDHILGSISLSAALISLGVTIFTIMHGKKK